MITFPKLLALGSVAACYYGASSYAAPEHEEPDVSVARDPELLRLMKEAGCAQILIGLESPTTHGMDGLEKKANWKHRTR